MKSLQSPGLRRAGALVIASAITSTTLLSVSVPAQAHPAGDRAVSAASTWLKAQLTDGIVRGQFETFVYDDFGLSADIAFALDAVGGHEGTVVQVADAVAPKVTQWYDSFGTIYAGSAAKAIALAQVAGKDATAFGGEDLQAVVEDTVGSAEPIIGRVQNQKEFDYQTNAPTDSLNVISQSWAARGLTGQGSLLADEVEAFLLKQQCKEGFFRATLTANKDSVEQGCVSGTHTGSVDTTALTVINILETPGASARAKGAALLAAYWLKTQQAADGSFSAGGPEGFNANSTGLAGWALAEAGYEGASTKAATWLRGLQITDLAPCAGALASENGAVAFKAESLGISRAAGAISVPQRDQYRRATAQALPALVNVPAGGAVSLSAPATAVEKSTVTVTVTGLGAGEPACVSLGTTATSITGTGAPVTATFTLPAGGATRTFSVATLGGTSTASTSATATPTVTPTLAPVPQVGALETTRVVKVRRNRFSVSVGCESATACAGTLKVRTAREVAFRSGKRVVTVAKREYSVPAGVEKRLVVKLTKAGRLVLADGKVKVRAVQNAPGAERAATTFWLKPAQG